MEIKQYEKFTRLSKKDRQKLVLWVAVRTELKNPNLRRVFPALVLAGLSTTLATAGPPSAGAALMQSIGTASAIGLGFSWSLIHAYKGYSLLNRQSLISLFVFILYAILGLGLADAASKIMPPFAFLFIFSFAFVMMLVNSVSAQLLAGVLRIVKSGQP